MSRSKRKPIVNQFWFDEARYDIIFRDKSDGWRKITAEALLERAIKLHQERLLVKDWVMNEAPDVWYKDNLGGYWVSVETWPAGQSCKLQ